MPGFLRSNPASPAPGIRDFWTARGKTSIWITDCFGSLLAPLCHRAGLSLKTVTVSGFLVTVLAEEDAGQRPAGHDRPQWY
jgi:hypothetical protein